MPTEIILLPNIAEFPSSPIHTLGPYISRQQIETNLQFLHGILENPAFLDEDGKAKLQEIHDAIRAGLNSFGQDIDTLPQAPFVEETLEARFPDMQFPIPSVEFSANMPKAMGKLLQQSGDKILVADSHALLYPALEAAQQQISQQVRVVIVDRHADTYGSISIQQMRTAYGQDVIPSKAEVGAAVLESGLAARAAIFGMTSAQIYTVNSGRSNVARRQFSMEQLSLIDPGRYRDDAAYHPEALQKIVETMADRDKKAGITNVYLSVDLDGIKMRGAQHTAIDYIPYAPLLVFSLFDVSLAQQDAVAYLKTAGHNIDALDMNNGFHLSVLADRISNWHNNLATQPLTYLRQDIPQSSDIFTAISRFSVYGNGLEAGMEWDEFRDLVRALKYEYQKAGITFGLTLPNGRVLAEITEADGHDVEGRTALLIQDIIDLLNEDEPTA